MENENDESSRKIRSRSILSIKRFIRLNIFIIKY